MLDLNENYRVKTVLNDVTRSSLALLDARLFRKLRPTGHIDVAETWSTQGSPWY